MSDQKGVSKKIKKSLKMLNVILKYLFYRIINNFRTFI